MIKKILKKIVPVSFRHKIRALQYKLFGVDRGYKHLSAEDIFDNIYNEGTDKALANPSVWTLSGYNSAQDFANAGKRLAISNCD